MQRSLATGARLVPMLLIALLGFWASAATAADNGGIPSARDQSTGSYTVVWCQPIGTDAGSLVVAREPKKLLGWQRLNAEYATQFGIEKPDRPPQAAQKS
jgi:hypothetical protein